MVWRVGGLINLALRGALPTARIVERRPEARGAELSTSVLPSALRETERIDRNWANARPFATARERGQCQPVAEGRSVAGVRAERGLGRCSGRCCIINVAAFRALEGKWWHRSKSCLVLDFRLRRSIGHFTVRPLPLHVGQSRDEAATPPTQS